MKKYLFLMLTMMLLLMVAACGNSEKVDSGSNGQGDGSTEFEEVEITFSHNQPIESPEQIGAEKFKEIVEAKTDGKVKVNVFPASQLGSLREQVEGTQMGEINITMQPTAVVTPFVDDIKVIDLPYLWPPSNDQTYKVLDGEVGQELLGTLEKGGFKGLGYWPGGFKLFTTGDKEVHKPEDFKGMTMRVMESPLLIEQYKTWGATAIPVPYAEVYNSLQQGVVDGQENPLQTIFLNNYHEVQKNVIDSYHGTMTYVLMANQDWFNGLSEDLQNVLLEAEVEGHTAARQALAEVEDEYRQKIIDSGTNYYKLTDEEIESFRSVSREMHKEVYNKPDQLEMLDKLYKAIDAAGSN